MNRERKLLIGSAPYIPEWWTKNYHNFGRVHCVNNAIRVVQDRHETWYLTEDFYWHHKDTWGELTKWLTPEEPALRMTMDCLRDPCWYHCPHNGTMVLNACYDILNRASFARTPVELCLVGCEMDYTGPKTHFYAGGKPDPLRIPKDTLQGHFWKLQADFAPMHKIVNSGQTEGLLPYEMVYL